MTLRDDILTCQRCPTILAKQDAGAGPVPPTVGSRYRPGGLAALCEAPGFYEARDRAVLVGQSGKLATRLMALAEVPRELFLLDNTCRCRPPNNRIDDYPEAVAACADWTTQVLAAYDPRVVVLMGRHAIRSVFGADAGVTTTRGMLAATPAKHAWGRRLVVCTWHPAAAGYAGGENSTPGRQIIEDLRKAVAAWRILQ